MVLVRRMALGNINHLGSPGTPGSLASIVSPGGTGPLRIARPPGS